MLPDISTSRSDTLLAAGYEYALFELGAEGVVLKRLADGRTIARFTDDEAGDIRASLIFACPKKAAGLPPAHLVDVIAHAHSD